MTLAPLCFASLAPATRSRACGTHRSSCRLRVTRTAASPGSPAALQTKLYARGGADYLDSLKDQLLTQAVLGQALEPEVARREVQAILDWVRRLGVIAIDSAYDTESWHYDIILSLSQ